MKQRNPAMDIIRSFALFCVISVHFFLNSGYYSEPIPGPGMYFFTLVNSFFHICVPLFMLLSGYLSNNKRPEVTYYLKIVPTLVIYFLASLCCMLYQNMKQNAPFSLFILIFGTSSFSNAPYSWYVEMYIGLFLLIPFLNVMFSSLKSKREKQLLILTLFILCSLPSLTNIFRFGDPGWWIRPSISDSYKQLLPSWWVQIYPLIYYFLGAYFYENPCKAKTTSYALGVLFMVLLTGSFQYYRSYGSQYITGSWNEYYSPFTVILSCLVFRFFQSMDYSKLPRIFRKLFATISEFSFGAYLVSWIFDQAFYPILIDCTPTYFQRFLWFPVIVIAVFISSLSLSAIITRIYSILFSPIILRISQHFRSKYDPC